MRYPQLAEAVKTTWFRESNEHTALTVGNRAAHQLHPDQLVSTAARTRGQPLGCAGAGRNRTSRSPRHQREDSCPDVISAEIDTDPFVYCVGAELPTGGILTAVLPRDDLAYIDLEFTTRH